MTLLFGLLVFVITTAAVLAVCSRSISCAIASLAACLVGCAMLAAFLSPAAAAAQLLPSAVIVALLTGALLVTAQRGLRGEPQEGSWISLPGLAIAGALFVVLGLWTARQAAWAAFTPPPPEGAVPSAAPAPGFPVMAVIGTALVLAACLGARLLARAERSG